MAILKCSTFDCTPNRQGFIGLKKSFVFDITSYYKRVARFVNENDLFTDKVKSTD
jgi:hypothetical protein